MSRPPPVLIEKHYVPYDLYVSHYLPQTNIASSTASASAQSATTRPASTLNAMFSNLFNTRTASPPTATQPRQSGSTDRQSVYVRAYETTLPASSDIDINTFGTLFSTLMNASSSSYASRLTHAEINANSRIINADTATSLNVDSCSICTDGWGRGGEDIRKLNVCGHVFHKSCIDRWLDEHYNCPLCRTSIVPGMDEVD